MLSYTRRRAADILKNTRKAVLPTAGPSGVRASEFPCEAVELDLYLLLPQTSDHLFNLEQDDRVALHADDWEVSGKGRMLSQDEEWPQLSLLPKTGTEWYALVKVVPDQVHVLRSEGWGPAETLDLNPCQ